MLVLVEGEINLFDLQRMYQSKTLYLHANRLVDLAAVPRGKAIVRFYFPTADRFTSLLPLHYKTSDIVILSSSDNSSTTCACGYAT